MMILVVRPSSLARAAHSLGFQSMAKSFLCFSSHSSIAIWPNLVLRSNLEMELPPNEGSKRRFQSSKSVNLGKVEIFVCVSDLSL